MLVDFFLIVLLSTFGHFHIISSHSLADLLTSRLIHAHVISHHSWVTKSCCMSSSSRTRADERNRYCRQESESQIHLHSSEREKKDDSGREREKKKAIRKKSSAPAGDLANGLKLSYRVEIIFAKKQNSSRTNILT